jgi:hyperosmotically inducible periplasmic protein
MKSCAALIAAAGLVFSVACAQTDAGITTNVKTKLAADDTVKAYEVNVTTQNGVVTLSGDVESAGAKERAIQIARGTDGVRDVIDQIRIGEAAATTGDRDPGDRDHDYTLDDNAARAARQAADDARELARDAPTAAGEAADRTGAAVTDAAITSAVKAKFLADTTVKGLQIDVGTDAGVVTLNGTVSSRAEADRAMMLARNTEGVENVVDHLKVGR